MEKLELSCKFNILTRPDSSVILCEGETCCIAGVYGPVEVKMQKIFIEKSTVECFFRPKVGLPGVEEKFNESLIRNICETALIASLHPRSAVLVNLQEMHNSGTLMSCAVNAACLACLDCGIDMKFMFGAVSAFLTSEGLQLVPPLDKTNIKAMFVMVFNNTEGQLLASHTEGCYTAEQYKEALELCREESKSVFGYFKSVLKSR